MALNLLSIVLQEPLQIDEEKLKFICSKHAVWDHFKISKQEYNSRTDSEKMQMLTRFYTELEPVYFGNGKKISCCKHCVWADDVYAQDCLRCKVNVVWCDYSSDDELFSDIDLSSFSRISHWFWPISHHSQHIKIKHEQDFWARENRNEHFCWKRTGEKK